MVASSRSGEGKTFTAINLAMSTVSFVSLLLIGLLTVYYVVREYHNRNEEMISEKSKSVLIELEQKLRDRQSFSEEDEQMLSALLAKFSKVFFTDINLYQLDGRLLATSAWEAGSRRAGTHRSRGLIFSRWPLEVSKKGTANNIQQKIS